MPLVDPPLITTVTSTMYPVAHVCLTVKSAETMRSSGRVQLCDDASRELLNQSWTRCCDAWDAE